MLIASSLPTDGMEQKDLSGREYMRAYTLGGRLSMRGSPSASRCWACCRRSGIRSLGQLLVDAEGRFAGVAVASYAISDFIDFYKQLRTEDDMLIALVGRDGIVRARAARATSFGEDVSRKPGLRQPCRTGRSSMTK